MNADARSYFEKFENLAKQFVGQQLREDGSLFIVDERNQYLITKHFKIAHLPLAALQVLPISLTPTLRIETNQDHAELWAWTAELVHNLEADVSLFKDEVRDQFELLIHLNLSHLGVTPRDNWHMMLNRLTRELAGHHVAQVIAYKFILSGNLSFPLLEGITRRKCSEFVTIDGSIKKAFSLSNGTSYSPGKGGRNWISSLRDELLLLHEKVASPELQDCMEEFKRKVSQFHNDGQQDGYQLIYDWRNEALHGEEFWITKYGVITNLICLILLHEIPHDVYSSKVDQIRQIVEWQKKTSRPGFGLRPPWSFYPP